MNKVWKIGSVFLAVYLLVWTLSTPGQRQQGSTAVSGQRSFADHTTSQTQGDTVGIVVSDPVYPVLTVAVRDLPPAQPPQPLLDREINPRFSLHPGNPDFDPPNGPDPLLARQAAVTPGQAEGFNTPIFNYNGQGYTFLNPPDTVGDVGTDHYIQMINSGGTDVAIYDKETAVLIESFSLTSLGGCSTGSGDPIVLYDQAADRWLLSEFGSGNGLCVFISQTPDPTGAYHSYLFTTPSFPDYPKYGVWADAYYVTANESSPSAIALNRTAMLAGAPATSQRFTAPILNGFSFQALTPTDLDGATPPPAGSPGYFMRHVDTEAHGISGHPTDDILELWAFSVNWVTPGNSSFTKIADILVAEFDSSLCGLSSFYCMGMPGVAQGSTSSLDPIREVIMNRLVYRNFGDHQTLLGNFVTDIGNNFGGVRWFELRKTGAGAWTLYQEGTYAPTTTDNRWMGGIAMDGSGNIALGYNVSSQSIYPSLRYAGRLATDPLGTLPQGEYTLISGTGVNGSNRYGDYAAMSVDPVDDCTFWFTGQWNATSQWSTRIGAFKFDACGTSDFTLSATPTTQDICLGSDALYDITVGQVQNYIDPVTLSASGHPAGTTTNFSVNGQPAPYTSTFTIGNTAVAASGSYDIAIVGVAPTSTHTTTVQLNLFETLNVPPTLVSPTNGSTDVPIQPTFTWDALAGSGSYHIEIATDPSFANVVDAATVTNPTYTPAMPLDGSTLYYWRVTANNVCGDSAPSATFAFVTVAFNLECNFNAITIPDSGSGTPYPSTIPVSGYGNGLLDVNVHLLGLTHTYPDDLDFLLVGPQGQNLIMMSDAGSSGDVSGMDLVLDDAAAAPLPDSTALTAGTYRPANYVTGDTFAAPAPTPSTATTLAVFNDTDPNGNWSLYLVDDAGGDSGSVAGGWCLELAVPSAGEPGVVLTKTVGTDPTVYPTTAVITVTAGTEVTYFYQVVNTGTLTLTLHTLTDDQLGTLVGPAYAYDLAPGASLIVTATATLTETVTNSAIWVATDGGSNTAVSSDTATVNVIHPSISLTKTVGTDPNSCASSDTLEVEAGTVVYYCYTVTNTGDVTLSLHDLTDDQLGDLFSGLAYDLAPGGSVDTVAAGVTVSATITATTVNTATWTAYNDAVITATATASATVTVLEPPVYYLYLPMLIKP